MALLWQETKHHHEIMKQRRMNSIDISPGLAESIAVQNISRALVVTETRFVQTEAEIKAIALVVYDVLSPC